MPLGGININKINFMIKTIPILFFLASSAACEPSEHEVGPYIITLDVGRDINWTTLEPMVLKTGGNSITTYILNGIVEDAPLRENHVTITLMGLDSTSIAAFDTPDNRSAAIENSIALQMWEPISISPCVFDGHQGMLGVAYWDLVEETIFLGQWPMNETYCSITSNIKWGKGTKQIFDTIHVEEIHD